ncbi:hypothetical protein H5410_033526 [Solanum commersonii]|uniref:Secreted protein n=1 Tax=Solanum commersonii TaxID=4109 RepID=A0A9J5YSV0_SOLCO|nr:hypothetical protein H5410_033526 [Solanum commersonii]
MGLIYFWVLRAIGLHIILLDPSTNSYHTASPPKSEGWLISQATKRKSSPYFVCIPTFSGCSKVTVAYTQVGNEVVTMDFSRIIWRTIE